jgi:hypothetical protein
MTSPAPARAGVPDARTHPTTGSVAGASGHEAWAGAAAGAVSQLVDIYLRESGAIPEVVGDGDVPTECP